jgi:hypothetical protein
VIWSLRKFSNPATVPAKAERACSKRFNVRRQAKGQFHPVAVPDQLHMLQPDTVSALGDPDGFRIGIGENNVSGNSHQRQFITASAKVPPLEVIPFEDRTRRVGRQQCYDVGAFERRPRMHLFFESERIFRVGISPTFVRILASIRDARRPCHTGSRRHCEVQRPNLPSAEAIRPSMTP